VPPFELHPFKIHLMNAEASYSFPSGDASLAFAMAMSLSITVPRFRWLWWTLAIIVGLERIAENAHYPSDVVAGAALGIAVALLARALIDGAGKNDANPTKETIIAS
jgi:membrane-associated phospholipid phosphatase